MPFLSIHGLSRYYEITGEGETVLFLHHGFGCVEMWREIAPAFLAEGYRVLLYDRRGYGRSDPGEDFFGFYVADSFRQAAVEELEALRQTLGLSAFHLVGQCEGGVVAMDYATAFPTRVKTVTASSTQCFSPGSMRVFNKEKFKKSFALLDESLQDQLRTWHGQGRAAGFYEQFRTEGGAYGCGNFDLRPVLPLVACPVLVLFPDRSHLFEVEQGLHFYRHLKRGELAVLPHCGHNTYKEQPESYTRILLAFLRRSEERAERSADG